MVWIWGHVSVACIALWMAGALYFDVAGGKPWGRWLVAAWMVAVGCVLGFVWPEWLAYIMIAAVVLPFVAWWRTLKPSHDRQWDANVAVLPRATIDDDLIVIHDVRNTEYRSLTDYTPRYEDRHYHLSSLRGADVLFYYWGSPWMSHPTLMFDFGEEGRICISIEVRYREGQQYDLLRSLYRQQEIIFVVADERDVIISSTEIRENTSVYLYQLQADPVVLRQLFVDYLGAINRLYERPQWYNGLTANCTTSIYQLPHSNQSFDWRVIINGQLDRALYEHQRLDQHLPFDDLKQGSCINPIVADAPDEEFGDFIRQQLTSYRFQT